MSSLVLMEIIVVIRKRIIESTPYSKLNKARQTEIREVVDAKTTSFIDMITSLADQKKVIIVNPKLMLTDYLEDCFFYLRKYFGRVVESRLPSRTLRYKGLGHYDIQHAMNARYCNANELISFDRAFVDLRRIDGFETMRISVPITLPK